MLKSHTQNISKSSLRLRGRNGNALDLAAVERYSIIRSFFTTQARKAARSPSSFPPATWRTNIFLSPHCSASPWLYQPLYRSLLIRVRSYSDLKDGKREDSEPTSNISSTSSQASSSQLRENEEVATRQKATSGQNNSVNSYPLNLE